jgi:protease I
MAIKKVALVIAHDGFQPIEYGNTKKEIEKAGYHVLTVSDKPGIARATDGTSVSVDSTLYDVTLDELAGFFLIGGSDALEHLDHTRTQQLAQEANNADLPLGAICISVRILAKADVLVQRKANGWDGDNALDGIFQEHGVIREHKDVVVDKNMITAEGPHAATEFGKKIVELLKERERFDMESKRRK